MNLVFSVPNVLFPRWVGSNVSGSDCEFDEFRMVDQVQHNVLRQWRIKDFISGGGNSCSTTNAFTKGAPFMHVDIGILI